MVFCCSSHKKLIQWGRTETHREGKNGKQEWELEQSHGAPGERSGPLQLEMRGHCRKRDRASIQEEEESSGVGRWCWSHSVNVFKAPELDASDWQRESIYVMGIRPSVFKNGKQSKNLKNPRQCSDRRIIEKITGDICTRGLDPGRWRGGGGAQKGKVILTVLTVRRVPRNNTGSWGLALRASWG